MKVHRKGEEVALRYRLHQRRPLVPVLHGVDCVPSYLIIGGLVFVPLSIPFLEHAYGGALALSAACICTPEWQFVGALMLITPACFREHACASGMCSVPGWAICLLSHVLHASWLCKAAGCFHVSWRLPPRDLCLGRPQGRIGASWRR